MTKNVIPSEEGIQEIWQKYNSGFLPPYGGTGMTLEVFVYFLSFPSCTWERMIIAFYIVKIIFTIFDLCEA